MAKALAMAGRACEEAGQPVEASKRFLRAGRSALLQGDGQNALKWLTRAKQLAEQEGPDDIAQKAHIFLRKLEGP